MSPEAPDLDHLIYVVPDLAEGLTRLGTRLGVLPTTGGRHPDYGTRNALVSLGGKTYLEIMGPDPEAASFSGRRPFDLDRLEAGKLVTWVARAGRLEERRARARDHGIDPGEIVPGRRQLPDGSEVTWETLGLNLVDPPESGLVPFLIDWGASPHPGTTSIGGCRLVAFHGEHPDPARVRKHLEALGVDLEIREGPVPRLRAELHTPRGPVTL
jgi:hypothetical protein